MKMLVTTAQTLPLYVSKNRWDKPPPLCGAIPAENSHIAKVNIEICDKVIMSHRCDN